MSQKNQDITLLLNQLQEGDSNLVEEIYPLVYDLHRNEAHYQLRRERSGHTFETTALVHEAYLKMVDQERANFNNRTHFLAVAALAMRRILVSYARKKNAQKRGAKNRPLHLKMAWYPTKLRYLRFWAWTNCWKN